MERLQRLLGGDFPFTHNAEAGNVEKCDGQRLDIGKYDALFDLIEFKFGGDYNAGFRLARMSSTPPTKAYGYRITLDGLIARLSQASYYCSRQTIPLWASTFAMGSCFRFSKTPICLACWATGLVETVRLRNLPYPNFTRRIIITSTLSYGACLRPDREHL